MEAKQMTLVIEFSNPKLGNGRWVPCLTQSILKLTDQEMTDELRRNVENEWRDGVQYRMVYVLY